MDVPELSVSAVQGLTRVRSAVGGAVPAADDGAPNGRRTLTDAFSSA
jgi:hypothetical protein